MCEKNKWNHKKSPIIWRELLDRGGKGLLLGGYNEFLEHAQVRKLTCPKKLSFYYLILCFKCLTFRDILSSLVLIYFELEQKVSIVAIIG